jgi:hypothetical protein
MPVLDGMCGREDGRARWATADRAPDLVFDAVVVLEPQLLERDVNFPLEPVRVASDEVLEGLPATCAGGFLFCMPRQGIGIRT